MITVTMLLLTDPQKHPEQEIIVQDSGENHHQYSENLESKDYGCFHCPAMPMDGFGESELSSKSVSK